MPIKLFNKFIQISKLLAISITLFLIPLSAIPEARDYSDHVDFHLPLPLLFLNMPINQSSPLSTPPPHRIYQYGYDIPLQLTSENIPYDISNYIYCNGDTNSRIDNRIESSECYIHCIQTQKKPEYFTFSVIYNGDPDHPPAPEIIFTHQDTPSKSKNPVEITLDSRPKKFLVTDLGEFVRIWHWSALLPLGIQKAQVSFKSGRFIPKESGFIHIVNSTYTIINHPIAILTFSQNPENNIKEKSNTPFQLWERREHSTNGLNKQRPYQCIQRFLKKNILSQFKDKAHQHSLSKNKYSICSKDFSEQAIWPKHTKNIAHENASTRKQPNDFFKEQHRSNKNHLQTFSLHNLYKNTFIPPETTASVYYNHRMSDAEAIKEYTENLIFSQRLKSFDTSTFKYHDKNELALAGFYLYPNKEKEKETYMITCHVCLWYAEIDIKKDTNIATTVAIQHRENNRSCCYRPIRKLEEELALLSIQEPSLKIESDQPPHSKQNINNFMEPSASKIQITDEPKKAIDKPKYPAYSEFNVRVSSYQGWPSYLDQTPKDMAEAGWFYAGYGDYTRCYQCGSGLRNWESGDDPWVEHARWFPNCALLINEKGEDWINKITNKTNKQNHNANNVTQESIPHPQIKKDLTPKTDEIKTSESKLKTTNKPEPTISNPRHPEYSETNIRISSYQGWPSYLDQTPKDMAEAGWFYTSANDFTRCYVCGGGLRNWESGDDPWVEHARWFPKCALLINEKGKDWIKTVTENKNAQSYEFIDPTPKSTSPPQIKEGLTSRVNNINNLQKPDMKNESIRLETYKNWKYKSIQEPAKLAKAGLYYTGNEDDVVCFCCKIKLNKWAKTDDPIAEHKRHIKNYKMDCKFIQQLDTKTSHENKKIESQIKEPLYAQENQTKPKHSPEFLYRFTTFATKWNSELTNKPDGNTMAEAGFAYEGPDDTAKCSYCRGFLRNWDAGYNPWVEHVRAFPHCSFLHDQKGNQWIKDRQHEIKEISQITNKDTSKKPEYKKTSQVKYEPNFPYDHTIDNYNLRLATFYNWPFKSKQTAEKMAEAGFFYENNDDNVQCFHCKVRLGKWNISEDPWERHALELPNCNFLREIKGDNWIKQIQSQTKDNSKTINKSTTEQLAHQEIKQIKSQDDSISNSINDNFQSRLASFFDWGKCTEKQSPPKTLMAQAGFSYLGTGDGVKCFYCKICLKNWRANSDPWAEHVKASPDCKFLRFKKGDEWIKNMQPKTNQEKSQHSASSNSKNNDCNSRASSFSNWDMTKHPRPSAEKMAEAGFFYNGVIDEAQCFSCNIHLKKWSKVECPFLEHLSASPQCEFLHKKKGDEWIRNTLEKINQHLKSKQKTATGSNPEHQKMNQAKNQSDIIYNKNNKSKILALFLNQDRREELNTTIELITQAGFSHLDIRDEAQCHNCGVFLKNWKSCKDPWAEHVRISKNCPFILNSRKDAWLEEMQNFKTKESRNNINTHPL